MALRVYVGDDEVWNEKLHPRKKDGEFAPKSEGEALALHLNSKGYVHNSNKSNAAMDIYEKQNGARIVIAGGQWSSSNPGNLTKVGKGSESLKLLLSGANPPDPPWQNSQGGAPDFGPKPPAPQDVYYKLTLAAPAPKPSEHSSIKAYTGSSYNSINDCLRYNDDCQDGHASKIETYLHRAKLKEPVTVYRGVKGEYAKILRSIAMAGTRFVDRGFLSASTSHSFAQDWSSGLLLKIDAPAGTRAAPVSHLGNHSNENEVLFQRGSAMVVKGYDKETNTLHVEIDQSHIVKQQEPAATQEPGGEPAKVKKPKKLKSDDPFFGLHTDKLVSVAGSLGYQEKLAPNAGIRRMRVVNFLLHHSKKSGKPLAELANAIKENY